MSDTAQPTVPTKTWGANPSGFPVVLDRYQVLGVIGEGGMGTVFKGFHLNLKRPVAIKTLRPGGPRSPDLVNRFLREMELVGQMDHPNVVRAADAGEKNGVFYLVMEYLVGSDLGRLVAERGRLGTADACELTRQAALGLDYIHRRLVHRDIKPSNLMLTAAGLVKVMDLGLARLYEGGPGDREHTPEGWAVGTYDYMAPEQAAGAARIDGRADLYSLGCTLFKLLTGRAPYSGPEYQSAARKLFAHCHVPLAAVEGFASLPEGLRAVLLRMTAKDPADRFASAREAARALAPFAADSRPVQLLGAAGEGDGPAARPLTKPLPEELSRLTAGPPETPLVAASTVAAGAPALSRRKHRVPLALCLLAGALGALVWFLTAGPSHRTGDDRGRTGDRAGGEAAGGVRDLDRLPANTYHALLDRAPVPVGPEPPGPRTWQWDRGEQVLDAKGSGTQLFRLGTTARASFTFEAGASQNPWMGRVGLFWGYREYPDVKRTRAPGKPFADFQMFLVWHRHGKRGGDVFSVRRGKGALSYNQAGETVASAHYTNKHDVPLLTGGEKILQVSVKYNRLARARLGPTELTNLCSDPANQRYPRESYSGALGLIALSHAATFNNVRFIAHKEN